MAGYCGYCGKPLDKTISYSDLSAGGELVFKMKAR